MLTFPLTHDVPTTTPPPLPPIPMIGPAPACQPEDFIEAVALVGTVLQTQPAGNAGECCEVAQGVDAAGWTFVADPSASRGLRAPAASTAVTDGGPRWPHYGPTCEPDWFPHSTDMECGFHTTGTSTAVLKITDIVRLSPFFFPSFSTDIVHVFVSRDLASRSRPRRRRRHSRCRCTKYVWRRTASKRLHFGGCGVCYC